MKKYHVAVEQIPNSSIMGMFGGPTGFSVIYFTCDIPEGQPRSALLVADGGFVGLF